MKARHRFRHWLRGLFGLAAPDVKPALPTIVAVAPLELPVWAAWALEAAVAPRRVLLARPLAAQLASQSRLNVPVSRKAFAKSARPKHAPVKRAATPRSVHLQARHLAPRRMANGSVKPPLAAVPALSAYAGPRSLDLAA
jgi:hypothetical protein